MCDTETFLALKYLFATAKEHDSTHFKDLTDSVSRSEYILLDSVYDFYDFEEIYNMIFERTSKILTVDVNSRRSSSDPSHKDDNLNRWIRKNLRVGYVPLYKRR